MQHRSRKYRSRRIAFAVAALVGAVGVSSCDSRDSVIAPVDHGDVQIVLSTDSLQVAEGDTIQLVGAVVDGDGRPIEGARITWISSDTTIAMVTSDGRLVGRQQGTVDVNASAYSLIERLRALIRRVPRSIRIARGDDQKAPAGTALAAPLQVRVSDRRGQPVTGIPVGFTVTAGGGRIEPANGTTGSDGIMSVRWTLGSSGSQTARATVTSSQDAQGMSTSSVDFMATIESRSSTQGKVTITVPQGEIELGDSVALQAVARDGQGAVIKDAQLQWASSNPSIATVDAMGRLIARAAGTVLITAAAAGCAPDSARLEIVDPVDPPANPQQVTDLAVSSKDETSITLRWTAVSDGNGGVAKYAIRHGSPSLNWGSAAGTESIVEAERVGATVTHSITGLTAGTNYQAGVASFRGSGSSRVASSPANVSTQTEPRAEEPPATQEVVDVIASPDTHTLTEVGQARTIEAKAVDQSGQPVSGVSLTWLAADPSIVTVNSSGTITARAEGSARVYVGAECCGVGDTIQVTVRVENSTPPPSQTVASVTATPDSHRFSSVGQTLQVDATARDGSGRVVSGAELSWRTTNSSVASVNNMGLVTARGVGSAMIIVSSVCCSAADTVTLQVEGQTTPPPTQVGNYPNLPSGMTVIGEFDGSVQSSGGHAFGISAFGEWSSSSRNQQVVDDRTNPTGSGKALRFTYPAGDPTSGVATAMSFPGGPYNELYIMTRIYLEEGGWNFGHKFFYVGAPSAQRRNSGGPTQFYVDRFADGRLRFINQNGTNDEIMDSSEGPPKGTGYTGARPGRWLNIEYVFTRSSLHVYVDGSLVGYRTGVNWNADGFNGMEWYGKTDTGVSTTSSYRLGELFIAGK